MSKELKAYGYVKDGSLHLFNQQQLAGGYANFEGMEVEITITKRFKAFGDNLRAYYFGIIVKQFREAILYAWGEKYSIKEVDYFLRSLYLYDEIQDPETGEYQREIKTLRKGQSTVSKTEFIEYCHTVIAIAATYLNWPIPYPNEKLDADERVQKRMVIAQGAQPI